MRIVLFIVFVFVSCSPEKRLDKFQKKHPDLFQTVTVSDTVTILDTLRLEATSDGKAFEWETLSPKTFTLDNKRSKTVVTVIPPSINGDGQVLINTITKRVEIPVVRRVVVTKEVKVPVSKVVKPKWVNKLIWFNVIFFLLLGWLSWYLYRVGIFKLF